MKKFGVLALFGGIALAACNPTPQQQHAMQCAGGTATGALVGAAAGNVFGGGTGNQIMTAAGGAAGATLASNAAC